MTNRQVVELIRRRPRTPAALTQIEGIGKGKAERYGRDILGILESAPPPAPAATPAEEQAPANEHGERDEPVAARAAPSGAAAVEAAAAGNGAAP